MAMVLVLAGGLLASAAAGGGILCMLQGRDVTFGEITAPSARDGAVLIKAEGAKSLRLGPKSQIVRVERIRAEDLRPGDEFIARNAAPGGASPQVLVFREQNDLYALYGALGHGTKAGDAARAASAKR